MNPQGVSHIELAYAQPQLYEQISLADPTYRAKVRRAVNVLRAAVVIFVGGISVYYITWWFNPRQLPQGYAFRELLTGVAFFLQVIGGWRLTSWDPDGLIQNSHRSLRTLIRFGMIAGLIGFLLGFDHSGPPYWLTWMLRVWEQFIAVSFGRLGTICLLMFLRLFAMDISDRKLISSTKWLIRCYVILYLLLTAVGLMTRLRYVIFIPSLYRILRQLIPVERAGWYVVVAMAVWMIFYLTRMHRLLGERSDAADPLS